MSHALLLGPDRQPNCIAFGDPQMCQHCGIISNGPIRKCKKCSIQVHESCLNLNNELCDLCFYDLDPMTRCMLCDREEEKKVDSCSRSRIPFVVVGFGRQYTEVPSDTPVSWQERGYARVTSDAIVAELQKKPDTMFPVSMMQAQRSYVEVESMVHMVAEPIVVHSWCACVFTGMDVTHKAFCETLFDVMKSKASSEATCYLCTEESDLLYPIKDHKSRSHSIHPSCGVRYGMQRVLCPSGPLWNVRLRRLRIVGPRGWKTVASSTSFQETCQEKPNAWTWTTLRNALRRKIAAVRAASHFAESRMTTVQTKGSN